MTNLLKNAKMKLSFKLRKRRIKLKSKYNTKQREKILAYLKENKDSNVTADEILNHFKSIENDPAS